MQTPILVRKSIGLGLAALGRPGYINLGHGEDLGERTAAAMERRCHVLLDAAYAQGVRYVDAARSYGRAEEFLASWLRERCLDPGSVTVASKWGYTYTAGWRVEAEKHEVKDHSAPAFQRQIGETKGLLGEHLRIYQIHSLTPDSPALVDAALLSALGRVRAEGIEIGFTTSGPRQREVIERALEIEIDGAPLFGCVQATWNLLETSCGEALAAASARGLRVVVKEALANGRLARAAPEPLITSARALGTTPDTLALAAALAQPWPSVVLSGAATRTQLEQNLRAEKLALDESTLAALRPLVEPPERYWATRASLSWN